METFRQIADEFFRTPFEVEAFLYYYIIGSFVVCQIMYVAFDFLLTKYSPVYTGLAQVDKKEWLSRTASTLHSATVFPMCLYVVAYDEEFYNNPVKGSNVLCQISMAIGVGYFFSDLLLILRYWIPPLVPIILHHGFAGWGFLLCIGSMGTNRWWPTFLLLTEAVTPFNNMHWMLGKSNLSHTSIFQTY